MNARALTTARAASRQRRFASKQTRAIAVYAVLLVLCVPFVFPFWWMITSSFKSFSEIFAYPPTLLPTTFNLDNYRQVFELQPFVRQYWNSLYIATLVTLGTVFSGSAGGLRLPRIRFAGSTLIFLLLLSAIMMPSGSHDHPAVPLHSRSGACRLHLPLVLLPMFAGPGITATFMTRQYFWGCQRN